MTTELQTVDENAGLEDIVELMERPASSACR